MTTVETQFKNTTVPVVANLTSTSRYVQTYFLNNENTSMRRPILEAQTGDRTIVIQVGSKFLKIGLAKDAFPKIIPHVIAYKWSDEMMLGDQEGDDEMWGLGEHELKDYLSRRHKIIKRKPPPNIYASILSYNKGVEPQQISLHNDSFAFDWTESNARPWIVGKEALRLDPSEGYKLRWPIRRGSIDRLLYRTYREAVGDMERIWMDVIRHELNISGPLSEYCAMIVVPGDVGRFELRAFTEVALTGLGLKAVSFILEPVACTFGAGISSACVVDMGAQCISVACVEEGVVVPDSLIKLPYGGDDLTMLLFQILSLHNLPYKASPGLSDVLDFELLNDLREKFCTLDEEDIGLGAQIYEFFVRRPGRATLQYHFKVFEERILALLAMFDEGAPWLTAFERARSSSLDKAEFYSGSFDLDAETKDGGLEASKPANENVDVTGTDIIESGDNLGQTELSQGVASQPVNNPSQTETRQTWECEWKACGEGPWTLLSGLIEHLKASHGNQISCKWAGCEAKMALTSASMTGHLVDHLNKAMSTKGVVENAGFAHAEPSGKQLANLSLQEAVLKSVQQSHKYLSSVLSVGGVSQTPSLQHSLHQYLTEALGDPTVLVDFVPNTRDLDPRFVAWKGGAVASKLEGCQETWIFSSEWLDWGPKIFRERLPFTW